MYLHVNISTYFTQNLICTSVQTIHRFQFHIILHNIQSPNRGQMDFSKDL